MALPRPLRGRRAVAVAAAAATVASVAALAPGLGTASSHREAPKTAQNSPMDNTDVYAFVSPDKPDTVTLLANFWGLQEPNGGPNFYPWPEDTAFDIKVDSDGDARPNLTYRYTFRTTYQNRNTFLYNTGVVTSLTDPDLNVRQTYDLQVIDKNGRSRTVLSNARVAPSNTGAASMPNYSVLSNQAITSLPGGGKSFAGQSDESFFLDLRVFDLLYGADFSETGQDTLTGYNVNTIALQLPKSALALNGNATRNPVIGVWSTVSRPKYEVLRRDGSARSVGDYVQVSRLGNPLVNEVGNPLKDKDRFNASKPKNDAQFLKNITNPILPQLIQALYGVPAPKAPRNDLVEILLTGICKACGPIQADLNSQRLNKDVDPRRFMPADELRLNMSIPPTAMPNRLGVLGGDLAGFPNGRRLADDILDIEVQAFEGAALPNAPAAVKGLGDGVNANDVPFRTAFPYIALPSNKAVNTR